MKSASPSCLGRLVVSLVLLLLSAGFGGLLVLLIRWIYPAVNPLLLAMFSGMNAGADLAWMLWVIVPGILGAGFSIILNLIANRILARRPQRA